MAGRRTGASKLARARQAPTTSLADLLKKWLGWLEQIKQDVQGLLLDRAILRKVLEIVKANPKTHDPNDFVEWFMRQYAERALIGVRRQGDCRADSISLCRLLTDISANANKVTRGWYHIRWDETEQRHGLADRSFNRWSRPGMLHVDRACVEERLHRLRAACKKVRTFATKRVAHHDQEPDSSFEIPTWKELDDAIDLLDQYTCDMLELLREESYVNGLLPTWQYDWKRVFDAPWRTQRGHRRRVR